LDQVSEKAASLDAQVAETVKRLGAVDDRGRELDAIDRRIEGVKDAARQAEQMAQKVIGPDGDLQKHRQAMQQLSSQALQTQASIDTLKKERGALEELRTQLRDAQNEVKQSLGQVATIKGEFDQIRSSATVLTQDYGRIRETSREAREDTTAAMDTIKD